jgi:sortase A
MKAEKKRKRAGIGTALMVAGGLLILSAASLFLYNDIQDAKAYDVALDIAGTFTERVAAQGNAPETDADPYGEIYIGVLRIPSLGLALPVMQNWSYAKLKIAPCRYSGSIAGDDMVIAAHNYRSHFGRIHKLPVGNALTYTDAAGVTAAYTIAKIETLEATDIEGMTASGYGLTLFTCTYGGAARIAVRCERAD